MDFEWHRKERILDIKIKHKRLREMYSRVQRNSRQLALAAILVGLATCAIPVISLVSCVFDGIALVFAFVSITRVANAEGEVVSGVATTLEANVITETENEG